MDTQPNLPLWLAIGYVSPQYRKLGIGAEMVKAVEGAAKKLQIGWLYLFTTDQEHFYTRLG